MANNTSPSTRSRRTAATKKAGPAGKAQRKTEPKVRSRELSPDELDEVRVLLSKPLDYKDDDALHAADAEQTLFDGELDLPEPTTDWFMSVMERGDSGTDSRGQVSNLLNAEQERRLFLQFNYSRMRVCQIKEQSQGQGSPDGELCREMLKWHRRANDLRDTLARFNLGLVVAMAKRSRARNLDFSEQVSEGSTALLNAIDKFNPALGYKFSTYACKLILNALNHAGIKQSRHRGMFATGFEISSDRADGSAPPSELAMDDHSSEIRQILEKNNAALTDLEQEVIRHRFPMSTNQSAAAGTEDEAKTLAEVGKMVGLTKEGVRRVQLKALKKIRSVIDEEYPELNDQYSLV